MKHVFYRDLHRISLLSQMCEYETKSYGQPLCRVSLTQLVRRIQVRVVVFVLVDTCEVVGFW